MNKLIRRCLFLLGLTVPAWAHYATGGPFTMTIRGGNTVELNNVLVGEVWICSGQSNMEMHLNGCADAKTHVAESKNPQIRLFTVAKKVAAGAQFVQTQFCMDAALLRRYVGALSDAGLTVKLAILVGINPLRSAKSAQWMKSHLFGTIISDDLIARMEKASDPVREGILICVDLIAELATIPGIAGVHIMAPGNDAAIPEVIAEAKSRVQKAAV